MSPAFLLFSHKGYNYPGNASLYLFFFNFVSSSLLLFSLLQLYSAVAFPFEKFIQSDIFSIKTKGRYVFWTLRAQTFPGQTLFLISSGKTYSITTPARHPYVHVVVSLSRIAQTDSGFCRWPFQSIVAFGNGGYLCSFLIQRELQQEIR